MSRILELNPPFLGLSTIVNVLDHVGPSETNDTSDVKVVQTLLRMVKGNFAKQVGLPQVTGSYEAVTGFWIYDTQNFIKTKRGHPNMVVDGIVSPAHAAFYNPGAPWTIVLFNSFAQKDSPGEYAAFVSQASSGSL
jgi:hypothetical protein